MVKIRPVFIPCAFMVPEEDMASGRLLRKTSVACAPGASANEPSAHKTMARRTNTPKGYTLREYFWGLDCRIVNAGWVNLAGAPWATSPLARL